MPAFDPAGQRVGVVEDVYVDQATGEQAFALVGNGAAPGTGTDRTLVPLRGSAVSSGSLLLAFPFDTIASAPPAQMGEGLTHERQDAILAHFGIEPTDEAMTRSEEQLVVDKVEVPQERVRLVKHVVTENVTVTVAVRREELRIEREPITNPEAVEMAPGAEIGPAEMEFFLLAEEPVVTTRVVPVERVRVGKDAVVDSREVSGEVRKERIDVEREPDV